MTERPPQRSTATASAANGLISPLQIREAFERRLQSSGARERAEHAEGLDRIGAEDYWPLMFGLLQLEIEYRRQRGDPLERPELQARFAEERSLVDALLDQAREPTDVAERLTEYDYVGPIHGSPYGGAYRVQHRSSGETRVLWRISAFFVDAAGLSAEQASADMVHLFHPNVAAPIELIQYHDSVYVISEYFEAENLAALMATAPLIPIPVVCEIISQVARGLSGIHSFFKAHADVRPANVLIGVSGPQRGQVKLSGVAGGLVDEHQARYAVWPAGLYHAPTFCAPEILLGTHDPDPRADVYSLGQVLCATLTGQAPQPPAGLRESISKLRPDCPADLEAAIMQMTAEDPEERFESAGEVLPIISKYASHAQLLSWLVHHERAEASAHAEGIDWEEDSLRVYQVAPQSRAGAAPREPRSATPTRSARTAAAAASRQPRVRRQPQVRRPPQVLRQPWTRRTLALLGLLAAMLVAAGVAGVSLPPQWSRTEPAPAPPPWLIALTELPGPNGDWWFDEIPWFTPEVRAELARRVMSDDPSVDHKQLQSLSQRLQAYPDYETVNELHEVVKQRIREMPAHLSLVARQINEIEPQAHSVAELKREYTGLLEELEPSEQDSATAWHLRATLLQASSNSSEAAVAYERALALYAQSADPASTGLQALCEADYGQVLAEFERNYRKANIYYQLGSEHAQSTALDVVCLCRLADSERKWGRRSEAIKTLTHARRLLQAEPDILAEHPLNATAAETLGWAAFDTWQLEEATAAFELAHKIRSTHSQAGNPRSWHAMLWIEQGQAMTAHFRGDQQQAQKKYRKLLDQIDSSLKGGFIRDLPKQQRTELAARRPNLYERLADCYLFGAGIDHLEACQALQLAVQATEDSNFDSERLWPHILALKYKYAMALVLAGDRSSASAEIQQADQELQKRIAQEAEITAGQRQVFQSTQTVARALLQLDDESPQVRQAAITTLEEYHASESSQVTRKNIDLVMLVSEQLLQPTVLPEDRSARLVRRLNAIIGSLRTSEDDHLISLYLQRYCESAQRALRNRATPSTPLADPQTADSLATVLAESRLQAPAIHRGLTRGSIQYDETGKPVSCRLHVLTIGVSRYEHHPELELAFADDDADALFAAYGQLCASNTSSDPNDGLFQRGDFRSLKDSQATRSAIIDAINDIAHKATERDLVIVNLSGHGTVDESGNFFFLPADYRDQSLQSSAIWDMHLRDLLTRSKSNAILVLDACHSGAATTTGVRSASRQQLHNALSRFTSAQKGLVVLAASLSSQTAIENPRFGHGVLTLALLEALQGKYHEAALAESRERGIMVPALPCAQDSSGLITLADIQYYIGSRVMGLTDGKQRATMNRLGGDLSMRDIPIRFESTDVP